jgi:hypothetical protein
MGLGGVEPVWRGLNGWVSLILATMAVRVEWQATVVPFRVPVILTAFVVSSTRTDLARVVCTGVVSVRWVPGRGGAVEV